MEQINQNEQGQPNISDITSKVDIPATIFNLFVGLGNLKQAPKTGKVTLTADQLKQVQFILLDLLHASGYAIEFSPAEDGTTNCTLIPIPTEVSEAVDQVVGNANEQ